MSGGAPYARLPEARGAHLTAGRLVGALLVAGGAMLFASKGLLAKALYARGVGFETLVAVRAVLALPLFWAFAASRESIGRISGTRARAAGAAALAGLLCYYVGALSNFYALTLIDASIERVLLFSYPAMVVVFSATRARRWPSRTVLTAVLLTYVGILLVVGAFDAAMLRANWLGAACVLVSALTYAIYFVLGERYTREIGAPRFTVFAMSASALALGVHLALRGRAAEIGAIDPLSWAFLAVIAIACMFVPALMQAEGVRRIGAERGAVVSTVGPPTTIVLAWLFLGETLRGWQIVGVGLILVGVLVLEARREGLRRKG